jgi:hypothetical protein
MSRLGVSPPGREAGVRDALAGFGHGLGRFPAIGIVVISREEVRTLESARLFGTEEV